MKGSRLAFVLLLAGLLHNNLYKHASAPLAGRVFVVTGHLLIALLVAVLCWVAHKQKARSVVLVCLLIAGYTLQVAGCNLWWMIEPWPVVPGGELCSDRLGLPLGLVGLAAACMVAAHIGRKP